MQEAEQELKVLKALKKEAKASQVHTITPYLHMAQLQTVQWGILQYTTDCFGRPSWCMIKVLSLLVLENKGKTSAWKTNMVRVPTLRQA